MITINGNTYKSGTYLCHSRFLNASTRITIRGNFVYNEQGQKISSDILITTGWVITKLPDTAKIYNLEYWVNGKLKETIPVNASYAICNSRATQLRKSTHRNGLLIIKSKQL